MLAFGVSSCASPIQKPGIASFGTRAGTTLNKEICLVAGFASRNVQDLKLIPFSFMGITGCVIEVDNRPLTSGSLPIISATIAK